jgi:ribosome maturation factor RimP
VAERSDAVATALEPVLAALGLDLYDLELRGTGPSRLLKVTIDRRRADGTSGIDLDAISAATDAINPVLDELSTGSDPAVVAMLRGPYLLEVTSPGVERTLRTPAHFRGAVGTAVSLKTRTGGETQRHRGVLTAADDGGVELDADDGTRVSIAYSDITQARTLFEWGPPSQPAKRAARAKTKSASGVTS